MTTNRKHSFAGKVAFLTGAASGIGRAAALGKTVEAFGRLDEPPRLLRRLV